MIVCYSHTDCFSESFYHRALGAIPEQKAVDIKKITHAESRMESTLGWVLTAYAAKKYGFDVQSMELDFGRNGKPYFKDSRFFFSISHSAGLVCSAASSFNVGLDVQRVGKVNDRVVKRVLSDDELALFEASREQEELFARLWSLKESFLKYTGQGISATLAKLDFSAQCLTDSFVFRGLRFTQMSIDGCRLCVCGSETGVELIELDENAVNEALFR